jgi:hypothetical protein
VETWEDKFVNTQTNLDSNISPLSPKRKSVYLVFFVKISYGQMEARRSSDEKHKKKRGDSLSALKSFYSKSKYRGDRTRRELNDVTNSFEHKFSEDDEHYASSGNSRNGSSENSGFYTARGGYVSAKYSLVTPRNSEGGTKYDDQNDVYRNHEAPRVQAAPRKSRASRDTRYNEVPNTARDGLGVGSARSICNSLKHRGGPRLEAIGDSEEDETCF